MRQPNPSHPFISHAAFKTLDGDGVLCVKSDHIHSVPTLLNGDSIVISHWSDCCFDSRHIPILEDKRIIHWYAQNASVRHPKLTCVPIGIASPEWIHGNVSEFLIRIEPSEKTELSCAHYSFWTNREERISCAEITRVSPTELPFTEYLDSLRRSLFTFSPQGNGTDCHRTWEAIYMRCIPVVIKHPTNDLPWPMLRLSSWDEWHELSADKCLYDRIWDGFDLSNAMFDSYVKNHMPHFQDK